jgi:hypothetical protein
VPVVLVVVEVDDDEAGSLEEQAQRPARSRAVNPVSLVSEGMGAS